MKVIDLTYCEGKGLPRLRVDERFASAAEGIVGDRFGQSKRRQVTLVNYTSWQKACDTVGVQLDWTCRRVNILVDGPEFSADAIGKFLHIGQCVLEVTCECTPCYKMNRHAEGLEQALSPAFRGGICCRVIKDGVIRKHATVAWHTTNPTIQQIPLL